MTLNEMAEKLRQVNPKNELMTLEWMAEQWWPDARWLTIRLHNHNGGARTGGRVAGAFAGRMKKAGLLRKRNNMGQTCYQWKTKPDDRRE